MDVNAMFERIKAISSRDLVVLKPVSIYQGSSENSGTGLSMQLNDDTGITPVSFLSWQESRNQLANNSFNQNG